MYKVFGPLPVGFEIKQGALKGLVVVVNSTTVENGNIINKALLSHFPSMRTMEVEVIDIPHPFTPL